MSMASTPTSFGYKLNRAGSATGTAAPGADAAVERDLASIAMLGRTAEVGITVDLVTVRVLLLPT